MGCSRGSSRGGGAGSSRGSSGVKIVSTGAIAVEGGRALAGAVAVEGGREIAAGERAWGGGGPVAVVRWGREWDRPLLVSVASTLTPAGVRSTYPDPRWWLWHLP